MLFSKKSLSFTTMITILSLGCFTLLFYQVLTSSSSIYMWDLTFSKTMYVTISFIFDWISTTFLLTLMMITLAVSLFSINYMKSDKHQNQFLFTLTTFIASMLFFIPSNNFLTMLVGWDGLGISSFLLIIYYQTPKGISSGMVTSLTNRIGDVLILASLSLFFLSGSSIMNNNQSIMSLSTISYAVLFMILLASFTKSAQMPFSSWLPAAMAAPTPVSALVHSSTLVTAGVFLMIRVTSSVKLTSPLMLLTMLTALVTSIMAGMTATMETDIKKLIALSTLSQLGVMMFSISMNNNKIAFLHLISHASFKALLFISAGWVLVVSQHKQDMREMGELNLVSNSSLLMITMASMSLMALPFLSGFYSKDMILESYMVNQFSWMSLTLVLTATALTTMYSMKMLLLLHMNKFSNSPLVNQMPQPMVHNLAAMILASGSVCLSSFIMWNISPTFSHPTLMPQLKFLLTMTLLSAMLLMMLNVDVKDSELSPQMYKTFEWNLLMGNTTPLSHSLTALIANSSSSNANLMLEENWAHQMTSSMPHMIMINLIKKSSQFTPSFNLILSMSIILLIMFLA